MEEWPAEPARLAKVKEMPRSVSQVKEYLVKLGGCGYRYYLDRVIRAWDKPAAWSPQGTAVHAAAEAWEKSGRTMTLVEAEDVYRDRYAEEINSLAEDTPNWDFWFASGPYRGAVDVERRYQLGLDQVARYVHYYTLVAPHEVIWITPDGEPAIELRFDFELDGVAMRGFIDQVVRVRPPRPRTASGALSKSRKALDEWTGLPDLLRVRDIKSGNTPGDSFQLGVYGLAIEDSYGVVPDGGGDYWMGRVGGPTGVYELMPRDGITDLVHEADSGIKAERFEPNPEESRCKFCSVRTACAFSAAE